MKPRTLAPELAARLSAVAVALATLACGDADVVTPPLVPEILAASAALNPNNALSAIVFVEVANAEAVMVLYGTIGDESWTGSTPGFSPGAGESRIPVLGLLPDTTYTIRVIAVSGSHTISRVLPPFATGSLPPDLPTYVAGGAAPSPGYVVFAAGRYGLAIDNDGRVVWYREFPPLGPGLNFQPQPNGRYVARPPPTDPAAIVPFLEIDPFGDVTRTLGCDRGLQPRFHDLIVDPDGDYWIMCDETRTMNLSGVGGSATARVTGTVIQHLDGTGASLFEWNSFSHFEITDLEPAGRLGSSVNWTHGNAIDLDTDGNLVVSFRSLNEITKIDVATGTGAVLWRMGGLRNQFVFDGTSVPAFSRQHGVRLTGAGRLTLLDNSGDPVQSRAERYVFDPDAHAAELIDSYGSEPPVIAGLGGTTQALEGGRTLVAYGDGGRVQEYDADGNVVWQIAGNPGYIFRAERIRSLYTPGQP